MKRTTAIFLTLAVLALGGLAAALPNLSTEPAVIAAGPEHVEAGEIIPPVMDELDREDPDAAAAAARDADPETWSAYVMQAFLDSYGRDDFSQFSDGTPHQKIMTWDASAAGLLTVVLENGYYTEAKVRWLALEILERGYETHPMKSVTVTVEGEPLSRTVTPDDL